MRFKQSVNFISKYIFKLIQHKDNIINWYEEIFKGNFFGKKSKKNFLEHQLFLPYNRIRGHSPYLLSFFRFEAVRRRLKRFLIFQIYLVKDV